VQVGDPQLVVSLANDLLSKHGVYLQPINYPTVPRGEELLRIAPTPHHSVEMMDELVQAARRVWLDHGLQLTAAGGVDATRCAFCRRLVNHDELVARHRVVCDGTRCDEYIAELTAAA